jgi:hypothetical protein
MKYTVHYIGEWERNPDGFSEPIFKSGWTKDYDCLDDLELFHRHYFEQMISDDEKVLHIGVYVYQIQK